MSSISGETLIGWGFTPGPWFKDAINHANRLLDEGHTTEEIVWHLDAIKPKPLTPTVAKTATENEKPAASSGGSNWRANKVKPLGHKAYGSIPHLPGSRLGAGDYHCHEGQERICFGGGKNNRGKKHRVIVTEKLDGSNVAVARKGGDIHALVRAGYIAATSPRPQHHVFDEWVASRAWDALPEGWRVSGEWLYQAHGTIYEPEAPFISFDAFDENNKRIAHDDQRTLFQDLGIVAARVIHDSLEGMTVEQALEALGGRGFHGAQEEVEGAVWRVETGGEFNFLTKYVRPDKVDGKYLDLGDDEPAIFMCDPLS